MVPLICAGDLIVGSQFIDPHRAGRRMARVVELLGVRNGEVRFLLNDDTGYGPWTASYPVSEQLEIAC